MKKIIYFVVGVIILSCSSDMEPTVDPVPIAEEKPEAVDDEATAKEDEELVLADLLENDLLPNKARIKSFDTESTENGGIIDNRDGTFTYMPAKNFVGKDSFTYTICDFDSNCSTASVTITVLDAGSPEATDDKVSTVQSVSININTLLENDNTVDEAKIFSIDDSNTIGAVGLNSSGIVTYTPAQDFIGEDTFIYNLCDDDEPEATCSLATVTITVLEPIAFNIPSSIDSYYEEIAFSTDAELNYEFLEELSTIKHSTILSYGERHNYLYDADEDLSNPENVILIYSGESRYWEEYWSGSNSYKPQTYNTEHVYPQSRLNSDVAVTDLHHLRVADAEVNEERLNYPFTEGSGDYKLINDNSWYPGDEWKGDVARMILYLNIRYGENISSVGNLELFLKWNAEDPVSDFERQRQEIIEGAQGNRNPFIDNPYLVTLIWGGEPAENLWE